MVDEKLLEHTANYYDRRGRDQLIAMRDPWTLRYDRLIIRSALNYLNKMLPKPVEPTLKFLDLCCGTGRFSIFPAQQGYHVFGLDLSSQSIDAARLLANRNGVEGKCQFAVGDVIEFLSSDLGHVCHFETCPNEFDVIFIAGSLYYLAGENLIPRICDRLKPGGHFFLFETNGSNPILNIYRRVRHWLHPYRDQQTLVGLLKVKDYSQIGKHFSDCEIVYFDFLNLLCPIIDSFISQNNKTSLKALTFFYDFLSRMDFLILNKLKLNRFAFKVVIHGKRPPS